MYVLCILQVLKFHLHVGGETVRTQSSLGTS